MYADFVRDVFDDYAVLSESSRFRGRVKCSREQAEDIIIKVIQKLEK